MPKVAQLSPMVAVPAPVELNNGGKQSADLTDKQREFAKQFVTGPDGIRGVAKAAAIAAGYAPTAAASIGCALQDHPGCRAEIARLIRAEMGSGGAVRAWALLDQTVSDKSAPLKLRLECANSILDRTGYVAPTAFERAAAFNRDAGNVPISQMTIADIEKRLSELSAQATGAAREAAAVVIDADAAPGIPDAAPDAQDTKDTPGVMPEDGADAWDFAAR